MLKYPGGLRFAFDVKLTKIKLCCPKPRVLVHSVIVILRYEEVNAYFRFRIALTINRVGNGLKDFSSLDKHAWIVWLHALIGTEPELYRSYFPYSKFLICIP